MVSGHIENCKDCDGEPYFDNLIRVCLDKDGDKLCDKPSVKICKHNYDKEKKKFKTQYFESEKF